ncbi:MAG: signal transduction response regulator [Paenibacillus sp.]|jgi:YesN/AraC family two-component response regulator|nr:signal transduction response regulator [Paenibacillus sp.]
MRVLIVEDEADILRGIQEVVEACRLPFETIFAVNNAEEALELIEEYKPDIILTDILLPEMTGLDMLEKVRALKFEPKVIVISSYNNFTYAQRSIQLGAIDYILKPIHKDELSEKIKTVYQMIQNERVHKEQAKDQTLYAQLGTETLKERFVLGLCLQKTSLQEHIHHRLKVWNLSWLETHSYALIYLSINKHDIRAKQDKDIDLENFAVGNITEETLRSYQPSVLIRNIHNDWVILTAWDHVSAVAQDILERVLKYQKIHLVIGISETMHSFQAISEGYEQAQKAWKLSSLHDNQHIVCYRDIAALLHNEADLISSQWVADCIIEGNTEQVEQSADAIVHQFMLARDVNKTADLSIKCFEWVLEIHTCLTDKVSKEISHSPLELWEKAEQCLTAQDLKQLLKQHLKELIETVANQQQPNLLNFNIDKAKRIIEEKFGEPITLQSVADELSIHPVWLSRLFKKETGQNFIDYLTEIRVEQAKLMLRNTSMKIYEIAMQIGYQEIQYFGKIFKKRTGITPKEYRYGK